MKKDKRMHNSCYGSHTTSCCFELGRSQQRDRGVALSEYYECVCKRAEYTHSSEGVHLFTSCAFECSSKKSGGLFLWEEEKVILHAAANILCYVLAARRINGLACLAV
jgi:hypothetical protein